MTRLAQGTVCKILDKHDVQPHKVRSCLERHDDGFEQRMAEVLCIYIARSLCCARAKSPSRKLRSSPMTRNRTSRQLAASPPTCHHGRDLTADGRATMDTSAHGTLSLLADIDLLTSKVHACVDNQHRSRDFVGFLRAVGVAYSADTAINLILDNHSAHISKEIKRWLTDQPEGRFTLVFTPKRGAWLNLVGGFSPRWPAPCSAAFASHPRMNPRRRSLRVRRSHP
jgi:hypothetical protein